MRQKPLQARSRQTVEAIVEATMLEITERGLAELTTTRVAERAGVGVGSLYQYFADKEALLDAVGRGLFHTTISLAASRIARTPPTQTRIQAVIPGPLRQCHSLAQSPTGVVNPGLRGVPTSPLPGGR